MISPANHSRAALNLLNDFLMRTCVPINARRFFVCKVTSFMKYELSLHSACVSPWERLRLKSSLSSGYVSMVFCTFVYKVGDFGGHEVNGFVDVCAPTNILVAWSGKNTCMETRQNVPPNIIYLPPQTKISRL